jgi:hypothetical protein
MADPVFKPRLPVFGAEDGQQVLTSSGNIFEFNAEKNEWVCIGVMADPDVVTTENHGLISPDLHRKLILIQELIEQGYDFSHFKLDSDVQDPYFYFFHSSDDLVKFSPEKCLDPKEVRFKSIVVGVTDNENGTSTIAFETTFVSDFASLVLETPFCNYNVISSDGASVLIDADQVNILVGDEVKVVKPEAMATKLRIEIDKGRLYQKLVRNCCVGPKGIKGDQGDTGSAGDSASSEVFQLPLEATDGTFSWDTVVETPIDTPISLRIFTQENDEDIIIEVIHPLDDFPSMVIINSEGIVVEETPFESSYDPTSKRFKGSIVVSQGGDNIDTWRFKARQRGAKGPAGEDGNPFLEVITSLLEDPSIRSTDAVLSMRRGTVGGDVVIFRNSLFDEVPVSNLSAPGGIPIANILEDQFTSVAVTVEEAKDIGFYQFVPKDFDAPPLDIPLWTPTSDCVQSRRWAQYRFDWFNRTEPDYLFSILLNPKPDEQCCQEDFFFCPNVGDKPCGITGEINTPIPSPVDCICVCENPIASELSAGGLVLPPMDLTKETAVVSPSSQMAVVGSDSPGSEGSESSGSESPQIQSVNPENVDVVGSGGSDNLIAQDDIAALELNTVESVIDGIENNFTQDIKLVGNGEIIISLDYDPDPCGGPMVEREDCAFVDSNAVRSFITLVDKSGTSVISGDGLLETQSIPVTAAFTVTGVQRTVPNEELVEVDGELVRVVPTDPAPGEEVILTEGRKLEIADLQLKICVNPTEVNYCRGYRLTIIAVSDENITCIPATETRIPLTEGTVVDVRESQTVVDDPTFIPPVQPPSFTPDTSFAGDGSVITGGAFISQIETAKVLLDTAQFVQTYDVSLISISGTGTNDIFIGFQNIDVGQLILAPSPSQSPLIHDGLQDNTIFDGLSFTLNKIDAGYDINGPLGVGTYVLGNNIATTWSSRIPNIDVRRDVWNDVVVYFSEPQGGDTVFRFVLLGRLRNSELFDSASSSYANELFNSGIADGVLVVEGIINEDPMTVIKGGSITFIEVGKVTIGYQGENVDAIYPEIVIEPGVPPLPPVTSPPGINDFEVSGSESSAGSSSSYSFTWTGNNGLPPNGQMFFMFPMGFNINGVNMVNALNMDGTFTAIKNGQTLEVFRSNDGTLVEAGTEITVVVDGAINTNDVGVVQFEMTTRDNDGAIIDGPGTSNDVPIIAGDPDPDTSTIELIPSTGVVANGVDTSMAVVTARDSVGNPIEGATVVLASSNGADNVAQPAMTTDVNGETYGTISATTAGSRTITATIDGVPLTSGAVLNFSSGVPADSGSVVDASPGSFTADGIEFTTVTICVVDALMNPVEGATVTFTSSGSGNSLTQPASPTDAFGKTTGTAATTVAEAKVYEATVNGSLVLSDTGNATAVAGPASDSQSTISASPASFIADGIDDSMITVCINDSFGNPVAGVTVTVNSTGSNNTFTPAMGLTNAAGKFMSVFTSTTAEGKTIGFSTDAFGAGTDTFAVTATPGALGPPDDSNSTVVASPISGVDADGIDSTLITVTIRDAANNPLPSEPVIINSTGSGNVISPGSGLTNGSGVFTSTMTSTVAEAKTVSATNFGGIGLLTDTAAVTFDPVAPPPGSITALQYFPNQVNNDGFPAFPPFSGGGIANENPTEYFHDITTNFLVPDDGKIVFDYSSHTGIDFSGITGATAAFMDGSFSVSLDGTGKIVTVERLGDGTPFMGLFFMDLTGPLISGNSGTLSINVTITTNGGSTLAGPTASNTITYSPLQVVPVLTIGVSHYPADQFTLALPDACAFDHWHTPSAFSVCSTSIGGPAVQDPDPPGCGYGTKVPTGSGVIADLGTPDAGGLPESNHRYPTHFKSAFDAGTAPFSPCPDLLVPSGVNHSSFVLGDFPVTYNLTFSLPFMTIPNDADIEVTFVGGAGAQLSAGTVGSFPAGDGTTSSNRVGQTVTITRNGDGTPLGVGFYLFGITVTNVTNPAAIGFFNITVDVKDSLGNSLLVAPANFSYSF